MIPASPVFPSLDDVLPETVFAKYQPEYLPLPAYKAEDGLVVSRWRLTWRERLQVLVGGNVWLQMLTFHRPLQPVKLTTAEPLADIVDRTEMALP